MMFLLILSFAMMVSCNTVYKNNEHNMVPVDITTARTSLNTENNGEGQGHISLDKRWYRPNEYRREEWRHPREPWRRW
jgi:hypothetical protein